MAFKPTYLRQSAIRKLIKDADRRTSPEFLRALDQHVEKLVQKATTLNPKKKTLDEDVAAILLSAPAPQA